MLPETITGGPMSRRRAREILQSGKRAEKTELLSLLLTYAEWDEIWSLIDEASLRKLFPQLDLPVKLQRAWARFLGLPAPADLPADDLPTN